MYPTENDPALPFLSRGGSAKSRKERMLPRGGPGTNDHVARHMRRGPVSQGMQWHKAGLAEFRSADVSTSVQSQSRDSRFRASLIRRPATTKRPSKQLYVTGCNLN